MEHVGCILDQAGGRQWADKYYLVEVVIPGVAGGQTGTIFNFPSNIQQINGKKIDRVWAVNTISGSSPKSPTGRSLYIPGSSVGYNVYTSLYVNGYTQVYNVLNDLIGVGAGGGQDLWQTGLHLYGNIVDWSISKIILTSAPGNTSDLSVLYLVKYY